MLFFKLLSFGFSLKETLKLPKQYIAKQKITSLFNNITDTVKKNFQKLTRRLRIANSKFLILNE